MSNDIVINEQRGFTLIEIMIVIAVIGVLAAIAYPNYQRYVIKTKRVEMMTNLQNIGSQLPARKMAMGGYTGSDGNPNPKITTGLEGEYPQGGSVKLYDVTISLDDNGDKILGDWKVTAKPKGQMKDDGTLTLDDKGIKCRVLTATSKTCGMGNEWNP